MALLHLRTAVKYEPVNDVSEGPEMQTPQEKSSNLGIRASVYGFTQNTLYLLSIYDQACHITSSNHIHSPDILSKDTEIRHVIRAKPTLLITICFSSTHSVLPASSPLKVHSFLLTPTALFRQTTASPRAWRGRRAPLGLPSFLSLSPVKARRQREC